MPDAEAEMLFQRLRQWRLQAARVQGVPPYVIFHDATLQAIAAAKPRTRRDLEGLPGLGAAKLERYGAALLAFLAG
jgi:ATP-dependent DNA helicase RecQ